MCSSPIFDFDLSLLFLLLLPPFWCIIPPACRSHVLVEQGRYFCRFVLAVLSQEVGKEQSGEPGSKGRQQGGWKGGNPYCFSCPINPSSLPALPPYASPLSPSFPLSHLVHRQHTPVVHPLPPFLSLLTPAILNPLATPFSVARFVNLGPAVLYGTHVLPARIQAILSLIRRGFNPNHPPPFAREGLG